MNHQGLQRNTVEFGFAKNKSFPTSVLGLGHFLLVAYIYSSCSKIHMGMCVISPKKHGIRIMYAFRISLSKCVEFKSLRLKVEFI